MTRPQKNEVERFTPGAGKDCHAADLTPSHQLKRCSKLAYRRVHPVGSKDRPSLKAYARLCASYDGTELERALLADKARAWLDGKARR